MAKFHNTIMATNSFQRTASLTVKAFITKLTNTLFLKKAVNAIVEEQSRIKNSVVNVECHAEEIILITVEDQAILQLFIR